MTLSIPQLLALFLSLLILTAGAWLLEKRLHLPPSFTLISLGLLLNQSQLNPLILNELLATDFLSELVTFILLPILLFQVAFKLDLRPLHHTLPSLLSLGILGNLLFTGLMTLLLHFSGATPFTLLQLLLFSAILSTLDPLSLTHQFKHINAPKRLILLLKGESLINNATAILSAQILIAILLVQDFPLYTLWQEWETFLFDIATGLLVGWLITALVSTYPLRSQNRHPFLEITLTLLLVFGTFYMAEVWLHVNAIMATVAVGLTLSRSLAHPNRIPSTTSSDHLKHFWEYLAYLSQATLFLTVGLLLEPQLLLKQLPLAILMLLAIFITRLLITQAIKPLTRRLITHTLPSLTYFLLSQKVINWRYRTLIHWGSLPNVISLGILLTLGEFDASPDFLHLVALILLLTHLIQGTSLSQLTRTLKLNKPSLIDNLLQVEGTLKSQQRALSRIPEFQQGGLFSARIAQQQQQRCEQAVQHTQSYYATLRKQLMDQELEQRLLFIRVFSMERSLYYDLFAKGHLSARSYQNLTYSIDLQSESIRHEGKLPQFTLHFHKGYLLQQYLLNLCSHLPLIKHWIKQWRARQTAQDYEEAWGRHQGNIHVLTCLDDLAQTETLRPQVIEKIRAHYRRWHEAARTRLDHTGEQFSEFVNTMQAKLAERLLLHAERETILEQTHNGFLPTGIANALLWELDIKLQTHNTTHYALTHLHWEPVHLLRRIPYFKQIPIETCASQILPHFRIHNLVANHTLFNPGDLQDSLFLIAQGLIRVSYPKKHTYSDLATLMAGDFFGEQSLLIHPILVTEIYRTVTPCTLYELRREEFQKIQAACLSNLPHS